MYQHVNKQYVNAVISVAQREIHFEKITKWQVIHETSQ